MSTTIRLIALFWLGALINCEEIRKLQFTTGMHITNDVGKNAFRIMKWNCVDRIMSVFASKMIMNGIDYRDRILEIFSNKTNLDNTCRMYNESVEELNKCSNNERNTTNALLIILKILCVKRYNALSKISECSITMEEYVTQKCQLYCTKHLKDTQGVNHRHLSCSFAICTANCINLQVRECEGPKEVNNLYNELAGAQMLLGMEEALHNRSTAVRLLPQLSAIPIRCRLLIHKALTAAREVEKLEESNGYETGKNEESFSS